MMIDEEVAGQDALRETAARWFVLTSAPAVDQDVIDRLDSWLGEDERHRTIFTHTAQMMADFDQHAAAPEVAALLQDARLRADGHGRSNWKWPWVSAAAVLLLGVMGLVQWTGRETVLARAALQTAPGEVRTYRLKDGSLLALDSQTRLTVTFTRKSRDIVLEKGQARFQVAHDTARPFQVVVADRKVVATGTDFNIERLAGHSIVTLLNGGVSVMEVRPQSLIERLLPEGSASDSIRLMPGDQLNVTSDGRSRIDHVQVHNVVAWQEGQILLDNDLLAEAVQRMNRSTTRRIILDDPTIGSRRISGMFLYSEPGAFAGAMAQFLHLNMRVARDGNIHLSRPSS